MVAPVDTAALSETHRDTKSEKQPQAEPVKLGLRASVIPDTLPFNYAKDKHALTFTVENTGTSLEIFKIKTTASYLYRIRPVFFKLGVRERQEVTVTYKGMDAGPIPLSAKDRITVVFAHALDPRKSTAALWDLHKPFAHLSYAESREYVRVLFVDETGRLAVSAAHEKSRGGMSKIKDQKSTTVRPEPPKRGVAQRDAGQTEEKSNNADNEEESPSKEQLQPLRPTTPRTPRAAPAARAAKPRTPSPNSRQSSKKEKSPATSSGGRSSRDPIESLLSSVAKDASAIVCVQYPAKGYDEGGTVDDSSNREGNEEKKRDMDTEGRRDEVLRKKMEEMRRREEEEKKNEEKSRKKRDEDRKKKDEEREERKRKEEEREEKKRKEEEREEREERKKKDEEREARRKKREEEEDRRKKEDEAEEEKAAKPQRRTSNEDVKQERPEESPRPATPKRRVLGADGQYHDDDSRYLDEDIRKQRGSVRLLKKGARTGSRDNSAEDDQPRRASLEEDN